MILNGLPWKRTEIILLFLRLHPSTAFHTLLLTMRTTPFLLRDSCLENLTNSMKRQKDMTLKDELPRPAGAQYATGEEWRNSSGKNEEAEPKQK